ncbi:MAG TPA: DUF2127 domain-containing protein [Rhodocyclaceae bacterium]|nr:DUF2127 domain-containing protein [Rhodocyclaceae bacterium]
MTERTQQHRAILAVACLEAFKGVLAIAAASGLLALIHKDIADFALRLVEQAHLNPAARYPSIFIDAAAHLQDSRLRLLALGAAAYSVLRLVEAYGLFHEKAWAEVLAAASGAIYIPFELRGLIDDPGPLHAALLLLNLAIVALMLVALRRRRKRQARLE